VVVERAGDIVKPNARFMMVGASSGPPDSMTRTCAPEADNSAARTERPHPLPPRLVVMTLDFLIRCVEHYWISMSKAEFHHGNIFAKGLVQD